MNVGTRTLPSITIMSTAEPGHTSRRRRRVAERCETVASSTVHGCFATMRAFIRGRRLHTNGLGKAPLVASASRMKTPRVHRLQGKASRFARRCCIEVIRFWHHRG